MNYNYFFSGLRSYVVFILLLLSAFFQQVKATHLRAGEIIVEPISCSTLTYRITIIVFTDTGSDVKFGEGWLDFGDGSPMVQLPQQENRNREDLGPEVATSSFSIEHTYASPGKYKIGYVEPNRNEGVLNIDNSVNTTFYVETEIVIDPFIGCNNSPVLLIPPIDRACSGVAFFHNPGAYDPDGDSIAFELVVPKKEVGTVVDGYLPPNSETFYENYQQGNENLNSTPTFSLNSQTGELKWDAPGAVGEYNIAFIVTEYREIDGEWFRMGFVTRDMQIIVEECDNERPELEIPEDICVEAGEAINGRILGTDPDNDKVKIEAYSQVFDLGATFEPSPPDFQTSNPAVANFSWDTECLDIRQQPYQVVFKITDDPPDGPKLVSFATWNITVVGPEPEVISVQQDGQGLNVEWAPYFCQNATEIQVWRRVDSNPYIPDECETGIRENSGYQLIDEVASDATSYKDNNLASAAKYCYRLVAVFEEPQGGQSIVSNEVCFEFVPAEEPIITNVSVEVTGETNGEIVVGWREPYEIDSATYPRPYIYKVLRAEGFSGDANLQEVYSVEVATATTEKLEFRDTGLNTLNTVYNYRIQLIAPNGPGDADPVESAVASSVRLEPTPQFGSIELTWSADVPWSNTIALPPDSRHLIYRGLEGDSDAELVLIDEVDVAQNGFVYVDSGQHNNTPLEDDQIYCYKVLTKGTYGNPEISSPLLNFSQMVCAQPSDSIPPCTPTVVIDKPTCEEFLASTSCNFNDFQNELVWSSDFEGECQDDVQVYQIYYAPSTTEEYELLAEVTEERFLHDNLTSFKGCYKLRAIDRSGNISDFSEPICIDNCPYYELPNVFTPGNNDNCNDLFQAFSDTKVLDESGSGGCGLVDRSKCARFVLAVDFTVYNRWGKQVYSYQARAGAEPFQDNLRPELINWDGKDSNGNELSSGIYYYLAKVTFDVVDPQERVQKLKGWVKIIR